MYEDVVLTSCGSILTISCMRMGICQRHLECTPHEGFQLLLRIQLISICIIGFNCFLPIQIFVLRADLLDIWKKQFWSSDSGCWSRTIQDAKESSCKAHRGQLIIPWVWSIKFTLRASLASPRYAPRSSVFSCVVFSTYTLLTRLLYSWPLLDFLHFLDSYSSVKQYG